MKEVFEAYLRKMYELFLWDVNVMSQPWMYWPLLIPIIAFTVFFFAKWIILTAPLWIPIAWAFGGVVQISNVFKK